MSVKYFYTGLFFIVVLLSSSYADWKTDANARIESIRKRNAQITVVDQNGNPVSDVNVQIEQFAHRFAFGTCINNSYMSDVNYKNFILNYFEWAVCENETKWWYNEGTRNNVTYTAADNIYSWCSSNGIKMRGHCLFWEQSSNLPYWVPGLNYKPWPQDCNLYSACKNRLNSAVPHFQNKFLHWDVDNEILPTDTGYQFFDRLEVGGPSSTDVNSRVWMHQRANQLDPNCKLFVNEYSGNSFGSYTATAYVNLVNNLRNKGAPIHGVGIQGHLGQRPAFDPNKYYTNLLKPLGAINLPIWVTEFDVNEPNDVRRAGIMDDFYRICFSDPNVEGILMWGWRQGTTWQSDWYLTNTSYVLNQTGQRYEALMNEWTTSDANITDPNGKAGFRGFHGTYEITLSKVGETNEVHKIELTPGSGSQQFIIDTNFTGGPPDTNAPTPNPMTWNSVPTATGSSKITMTATTASDETPPVQYYFQCTNDGNASSSWQTDTTYAARNLRPSTQYTFRVKARDNDVNLNETDWSGEESATTLPPSAQIEIASWISGLRNDDNEANELGFNRALVFIAHCEEGGVISLNSVTYGGQTMTKIIDRIAGTGTRAYVAAYILDKAGITAAGADGNFVPSWSATPDEVSYSSVFLSNVNQIEPNGAAASNGTSTSTPNPITTDPLTTDNGDMVIDAATCGVLGDYTVNNGFTKGIEQDMASSTGVTGYKAATGVFETPSVTFSPTPSRQVIIGFVVQASAPLTCGQIQAAGFGLLSDLNDDCRVDYEDLKIISDYWLNTECGSYNNCGGADFAPTNGTVDFFDLNTFAKQWMQCNDPEGSNCVPNW